MATKTAIVIAAYNEKQTIFQVVKDVKNAGYNDIIVVDDGSADDTAKRARNTGATVLRHVINRGQGAGLRTGINYAVENEADIIVTYDADGQFEASEISDVTAPITKNEADVVLGSRFLGKKANNMSAGKKLVLKLGAVVTWVFSGIWLTDSHNGFRALSREAAQKITITFDRMEHASEIIEEIAHNKLRYKEVPVTVHYHEAGQHPIRSIKMGIKLVLKKVIGW